MSDAWTSRPLPEAAEDGFARREMESPSTTSLQNPTDPECRQYCVKAGKDHIGYAANVVESVDSSGSVITDYQYEKNIFSDPRFLRDHLTRTEEQKETVRIVADGGYVGQECRELAAEKILSSSIQH